MLLKQNLKIYQIISITWKVDLFMLALCLSAHVIDMVFFPTIHIPTVFPILLGTALAFFIGFNNNQAYARWWEARGIWGELVNDSRTLTRSIISYCPDITTRRRMVLRQLAFLNILAASLRKIKDNSYAKYLDEAEHHRVARYTNIPNTILDEQVSELTKLRDNGTLDGYSFLVIHEVLRRICDAMGKSERINNTVFPTTYFTRLFIWIFVVLVTMATADSVGFLSIFFSWLIGSVFHITHVNGMSLMNPFEKDNPSGVPINSITRSIEINLLEALGEENIPHPLKPFKGDYIL